MSEEDKKIEKPDQKNESVTETTLIDKSKNNKKSEITSAGAKQYSFGMPQILLGIAVVAVVAGLVGYSASKRNDIDDRMLKRSTLRTDMSMMGGDREFGNYSTGGGYGMNSGGTTKRGMYRGESGIVSTVNSTSISIKPMQGGLTTFTIDNSTKVYNGTNTASASDLKAGQTVRVQADLADSTKASQITIE